MRATWSIVIGLAVALGTAACTTDPQPDGNVGTLELRDGSLAVDGRITFTAGEAQQTRGFTVRNVGTGELTIDALTITSTPPGTFVLARDLDGTPFAPGALPATLLPSGSGTPSDEELVVFITFNRPPEGVVPTGQLTIESDSVKDGVRDFTRVFDLAVEGSRPRLQVLPTQIDFGNVGANQSEVKSLSLVNQGGETLVIDRFRLEGHPAFALRAEGREWKTSDETTQGVTLDPPIEVGGLQSVNVTIVFTPTGAEPASGNLILFSNDPLQTSGTVVPLAGNVGGPCIVVNPSKVNFGGKLIAKTATVDVEVTSCGDADLVISEIFLDDSSDQNYDLQLSGFGVQGTPPVTQLGPADSPVRLAPNQRASFQVTYTPDIISPFDGDGNPVFDLGEIVIRSNAFVSEARVEVLGFGVEVECPTPVIIVQEGEEVIPQTTLHLVGSQSFASTGTIQAYKWSVVQPVGSQSVFLPSDTQPDPTFEVNVAGTYVFRLTVTDSVGEDSCFPAEFTVFVNPDEALHIELLWDTPNDPDQSDEGPVAGADLDLHFLHPFASGQDIDGDGAPDGWFDIPWDAFWYNPHPNWGSFDEAIDDNPGLDRDDTDGAGPENVNLNEPEDGAVYTVGVHYWNDHGFGSSFATLRVYVFSNLVFELEGVKLNNHDMWRAARVAWPSGLVSLVRSCENKNLACTVDSECGAAGVGVCGDDFRIAPNYIHPFFPAGP